MRVKGIESKRLEKEWEGEVEVEVVELEKGFPI